MEDWEIDTAVASVEYERERKKLNEPTTTTGATGASSGCFILIGLLIGLFVLAMVCLWLIMPS